MRHYLATMVAACAKVSNRSMAKSEANLNDIDHGNIAFVAKIIWIIIPSLSDMMIASGLHEVGNR